MRNIILCAALAVFGLGCSGGVGKLCEDGQKAFCEKMHECATSKDDAFIALFGNDVSECLTKQKEGATYDAGGGFTITIDGTDCSAETEETACDDASYPVYNSDKAQACIDGYPSVSCDDLNNGTYPSACNEICTAE